MDRTISYKYRIEDLAIFGGEPAFQEKLHVGRPNTGNRERLFERLNNLLDRKWLTNNGPFVQELEQRIAALLGVKHCITVCNGTQALEIAAQAMHLSGEVILPSFTHISTAYALHRHGITPVFCDIDPHTHTIDPDRIAALITPRTTGIVGVHLWGHPCNIDALEAVAGRYHLKLLFDAAHAFKCSHRGRMIGQFGDAEAFSFHATKFFNTLEGGAVVTRDDALAGQARLLRNTGFASQDADNQIGTNAKMTEMAAAVGLTILEELDEIIATNYHHYKLFQQELEGIPGVQLVPHDESEQHNFQYIVIEVDKRSAHLSRDMLMQLLWQENVLARDYFFPGCHLYEPFLSLQPHLNGGLPVTDRLAKRVLCLPTGPVLSPADVRSVCHLIRFAIANGQAIREQFPNSI